MIEGSGSRRPKNMWIRIRNTAPNLMILSCQVIEVMIRHEEGLARDVVKHLQRIEEQILECRAWAASSPLWDAIRLVIA